MPVGTAASVKALVREDLQAMGASIVLANTYHLYLRPGHEIVRGQGGLHRFMSWNGSLLTDSGGFQVFSQRELNRIDEDGVEFRSHLDGSRHVLTPEKSIEIQRALGADIAMAFDDCTPHPVEHAQARDSMRRSMRWAERCKAVHRPQGQALFGIIQGSLYSDLRRESLQRLEELDFPGLALGGFSVGEPKQAMHEMVAEIAPLMPADKPRYLMGVGTPLDLVRSVRSGIDMFDCVLPTRNARNGTLFTWQGKVRIKNAKHADQDAPLDPQCACRVCRSYSRSYLRHLFLSGEILSSILNSYHNVAFYLGLMREIRRCIAEGGLEDLEMRLRRSYDGEE